MSISTDIATQMHALRRDGYKVTALHVRADVMDAMTEECWSAMHGEVSGPLLPIVTDGVKAVATADKRIWGVPVRAKADHEMPEVGFRIVAQRDHVGLSPDTHWTPLRDAEQRQIIKGVLE